MSDFLSKNILTTIIYYDCLDYPLTIFEIWKHLIRTDYYTAEKQQEKFALSAVAKILTENKLGQFVENLNGFYFLKGRKFLVEKRIAGNKISAGKIKKIVWLAKLIRCIPFVRMIGLTGKVAMKNAKAKSDLDLFIVLKAGKIWTGRTLVTFFLHLIGVRRHGQKVSDRACLNFFVTDESLEIAMKDLFSASEYMFILPLFGEKVFERFQIRNQWIRIMKPAFAPAEIPPLKIVADSDFSRIARGLGEFILSFAGLEKFLKKIEKKKILQNPKTAQEGSLIHADDDALVFLPSPRGPLVFERFKSKVDELSV
jgi:hypothetical protein